MAINAWSLETVLVIVALVGCHGTPPGSLVGESQHFRLYVDPDLTVPAGFEGDNALAALETEWADVHSMLEMPDGKITYYWVSPAHIGAACGILEAAGCFWSQNLEVDAATLPQPHELNHAYMYLRKQRFPLPLLAEGIAEAIACGDAVPTSVDEVPWEEAVVAYPPAQDPYVQGGAFVRYLIRTYGTPAFLSYYEQAPDQRDPATFAANFQSFWGITIDDAWTSSHEATLTVGETKICPCSLPPIDTTGAVANDPARAPYWPLPETAGQTLALSAKADQAISIQDCAGVRPQLVRKQFLLRLDGGAPRYVVAPVEKATVDSYLADACADAAPFSEPILDTSEPLPEALFGGVTIGISRPPSGSATVYLNLASSFSATLNGGLTETCGTCAFDQGSCQPLAAGAIPEVQGPFLGRATLATNPALPTLDLLSDYIDILGQ